MSGSKNNKNTDLWLGNSENKLTESDRRILSIHWVGERLQLADYNKNQYLYFAKNGCLIIVDGSSDSKS